MSQLFVSLPYLLLVQEMSPVEKVEDREHPGEETARENVNLLGGELEVGKPEGDSVVGSPEQ